jgi:pre-rRNA-processing protein TSR1
VGYLQHLPALQAGGHSGPSAKAAAEFKRRAATFMADEFGTHAKVAPPPPQPSGAFAALPFSPVMLGGGMAAAAAVATTTAAVGDDVSALLRAVCEVPHRPLGWRDSRSHLLAESVSLLAEPSSSPNLALHPARCALPGAASQAPVLCVSGYLRGAPLNVHQLVHVPGLGARRVLRVLKPQDPCPAKPLRGPAADAAAAARAASSYGAALVCCSDPARGEPVELSAAPDMFNGEQTWPDPAEYGGGGLGDQDDEAMGRKLAGVSDYQAAWMGQDGQEGNNTEPEDDEEEDEDEGAPGGMSLGSAAGMAAMRSRGTGGAVELEEEDEEDEEGEEDPGAFAFLADKGLAVEGLDSEMTEAEAAAERLELRRRRAAEEMDFPDEVDCPVDVSAKERFARFEQPPPFSLPPPPRNPRKITRVGSVCLGWGF